MEAIQTKNHYKKVSRCQRRIFFLGGGEGGFFRGSRSFFFFLFAPGLLSAGPTVGEGEMSSILPQPVPP